MSVRGLIHAASAAGLLSLTGVASTGIPLIGVLPAMAASKTIDVDALQKLVAGLGLEDSGDKKTYARVVNQGSQGFTVMLYPSEEQTTLLVYTALGDDIPADKVGSVPMEQMLEYNDSHPCYFTMSDDSGNKRLFLQCRLAAPMVTPQSLRASIDGLLSAADDTKELWVAENWKTVSTGAAGASAAAAKPFSTSNVMFVDQKISSYGDFHKRPTNVFAPGEQLITYIEPVGFDYKKVGADTYQFGVAIDLDLKDKAGKTLGDKANFLRQELTSHYKDKEFFCDLKLSLNDFPTGEYVVTYTLHDIVSNQTTRVEQPFTIKAASQ